MTGFDKICAA